MSEHRLHPRQRAYSQLSETQIAYATWAAVTTGCDEAAHQLVNTYGPIGALARARYWLHRPRAAGRYHDAVARWTPNLRHVELAQLVLTQQQTDGRLLTPADPNWPVGLAELGLREPFALWMRGAGTQLERHGAKPPIAIIGARSCTANGTQLAAHLAHELARRGHPIISAGGIGIDAAAHRAALETTSGTIAVLAGGLDRPYPAVHRELFHDIAANGLIISEAPPTIRPSRSAFLHRMRLIAALSGVLVIVQTPMRGGALIAAQEARTLGRHVGAMPGQVNDLAHAGCLALIHAGNASLVRDADDVSALVSRPAALTPPRSLDDDLHPTLAKILAALPHARALAPATITAITGIEAGDVLRALDELAERNLVHKTVHGWQRMAR